MLCPIAFYCGLHCILYYVLFLSSFSALSHKVPLFICIIIILFNTPITQHHLYLFQSTISLHISTVLSSTHSQFSILVYCYMPVCELGSTSFSAIPVTSPSAPSLHLTYRLLLFIFVSSSLRLPSFVLVFVTDLFHPYHVPSIIPRFCGWTILL